MEEGGWEESGSLEFDLPGEGQSLTAAESNAETSTEEISALPQSGGQLETEPGSSSASNERSAEGAPESAFNLQEGEESLKASDQVATPNSVQVGNTEAIGEAVSYFDQGGHADTNDDFSALVGQKEDESTPVLPAQDNGDKTKLTADQEASSDQQVPLPASPSKTNTGSDRREETTEAPSGLDSYFGGAENDAGGDGGFDSYFAGSQGGDDDWLGGSSNASNSFQGAPAGISAPPQTIPNGPPITQAQGQGNLSAPVANAAPPPVSNGTGTSVPPAAGQGVFKAPALAAAAAPAPGAVVQQQAAQVAPRAGLVQQASPLPAQAAAPAPGPSRAFSAPPLFKAPSLTSPAQPQQGISPLQAPGQAGHARGVGQTTTGSAGASSGPRRVGAVFSWGGKICILRPSSSGGAGTVQIRSLRSFPGIRKEADALASGLQPANHARSSASTALQHFPGLKPWSEELLKRVVDGQLTADALMQEIRSYLPRAVISSKDANIVDVSALEPKNAATRASEVQSQLMRGERASAAQTAMDGNMWASALLLATYADQQSISRGQTAKKFKQTAAEYARRAFGRGTPLQALHLLFAGDVAGACDCAVEAGVALCIDVLLPAKSVTPSPVDSSVTFHLAAACARSDDMSSAACLLAYSVLRHIGLEDMGVMSTPLAAVLSQQPSLFNPFALQVIELAHASHGPLPKGKAVPAGLAALRLQQAMWLFDLGLHAKAREYVNAAQTALPTSQKRWHRAITDLCKDLDSHIAGHVQGGASATGFGNPNGSWLDWGKVRKAMDRGIEKLVHGDDDQSASQGQSQSQNSIASSRDAAASNPVPTFNPSSGRAPVFAPQRQMPASPKAAPGGAMRAVHSSSDLSAGSTPSLAPPFSQPHVPAPEANGAMASQSSTSMPSFPDDDEPIPENVTDLQAESAKPAPASAATQAPPGLKRSSSAGDAVKKQASPSSGGGGGWGIRSWVSKILPMGGGGGKNQVDLGEDNDMVFDEASGRWIIKGQEAQPVAKPAPPPTAMPSWSDSPNPATGAPAQPPVSTPSTPGQAPMAGPSPSAPVQSSPATGAAPPGGPRMPGAGPNGPASASGPRPAAPKSFSALQGGRGRYVSKFVSTNSGGAGGPAGARPPAPGTARPARPPVKIFTPQAQTKESADSQETETPQDGTAPEPNE